MNPSQKSLTLLYLFMLALDTRCFFPFGLFKKAKNTESPIIGIMSVQDFRFHDKDKYYAFAYNSYIAESYVHLVQLAGATPVFIEFDMPLKQLDWLMENIDGLIMPGADALSYGFPKTPNMQQKRVMWMVEKAKTINNNGKYFPVFSECFGFEAIILGLSDYNQEIISEDLNNIANQCQLEKTDEFENSKLWTKIDPELLERVWESGHLPFSHNKGIYPKNFVKIKKLRDQIRVTGTAISRNGKRFVAQYEFKDYPIFATQYHIEKTAFVKNYFNKHLKRNPDLVKFGFEQMNVLFAKSRKYAKPRADLDRRIIGRMFQHHRQVDRYMYVIFDRIYVFRRYERDDYIPRTFADQKYELKKKKHKLTELRNTKRKTGNDYRHTEKLEEKSEHRVVEKGRKLVSIKSNRNTQEVSNHLEKPIPQNISQMEKQNPKNTTQSIKIGLRIGIWMLIANLSIMTLLIVAQNAKKLRK